MKIFHSFVRQYHPDLHTICSKVHCTLIQNETVSFKKSQNSKLFLEKNDIQKHSFITHNLKITPLFTMSKLGKNNQNVNFAHLYYIENEIKKKISFLH